MAAPRTWPALSRGAQILACLVLWSALAHGQPERGAVERPGRDAHGARSDECGLDAPDTTQSPAERGGETVDQTLPASEEEGGFDIARHFSLLLFPKVFADAWLLREFVRSGDFAEIRREHGDVAATDAMFARARELSWHNNAEALLISLAASIDHRRVGIRVPPLGITLWLPLTSEFPDEFGERIAALPRRIYPDTPPGRSGDRDKLQHFFGSALLAFLFEAPGPSDRFGDFVEWGEERFIVDGTMDPRDLRANWQGQQFGLALLDDPRTRPSRFLRVDLAHESLPSPEFFPRREEPSPVDPEVP